MIDKVKFKNLAKKLRDVAKEMDELLKDNPDAFSSASRDSIVVKKKVDVHLYVEAQEVIRRWATRWQNEFKAAPYIEKSYVYMTVAVLKKLGVAVMLKAVDNYFDEGDAFTERQRFPYTLFIKTINKHLPEGTSDARSNVMGPLHAGHES